jgi:hypothetical protein
MTWENSLGVGLGRSQKLREPAQCGKGG